MRGFTNPDLMDDRVRQVGPVSFKWRKRSKTTLLVIHDSHTPPSVVRPIEHLRWQGRRKGLLEIGYHLIIDRTGGSHLIRPIDSIGNHAPGLNHVSIGICLIGGRTETGIPDNNFTEIQLQVLEKYCAGFKTEFPEAEIVGCSEVVKWKRKGGPHSYKCPCFDMNIVRQCAHEDDQSRTLTEMVASRTYRTTFKGPPDDQATHADSEHAYPSSQAHP